MTNELFYQPGDEVPVEVVADSNDAVAREGEGVEITGEGESLTQVRLVESENNRCPGILASDPSELADPDNSESDYSNGDSVGEASLMLLHPVIWVTPESGYSSPAVGDYVRMVDGGQVDEFTGPTASGLGGSVSNNIGIANDGTIETDNGTSLDIDFTEDAFPFGYVFTTIAREWGVQGKIAVMRGVV